MIDLGISAPNVMVNTPEYEFTGWRDLSHLFPQQGSTAATQEQIRAQQERQAQTPGTPDWWGLDGQEQAPSPPVSQAPPVAQPPSMPQMPTGQSRATNPMVSMLSSQGGRTVRGPATPLAQALRGGPNVAV